MSADNGIYVAKFLDGFRVTHAQAIENVDYYPEGSKERKEELRTRFGDSPIFPTEDTAMLYAHDLEAEITRVANLEGFCGPEYGVCYIGEYESFDK